MVKKSKISEEDEALFRANMRDVKPIKYSKVTLRPAKSAPMPKKVKISYEPESEPDFFSDYEKLPPVSGEDLLEFSRSGLQHKTLRNLRNGKYNIESILDLHGMTVSEARESLGSFLVRCRKKKVRLVLIIHGKGRDTSNPILKNKLNHWLRQTEQVLAFCSATIKHGRSGALYVLLKAESA
jgi:DNA-nicking Smr family endonuclease